MFSHVKKETTSYCVVRKCGFRFVIVEFTVTKQGAVRDPIVVEANPSGIFEQAAIDAAMKFKYKPRVVNGEATEVSGVQNRITFQIDG